MREREYGSPQALKSALLEAARLAALQSPEVNVQERLRRAYLDRFLCRVFIDDTQSTWVLKGGTSMIARIPNGRLTKDVDLYSAVGGLEDALEELRRLAEADLSDFFSFVYLSHGPILEAQVAASGYEVQFDVYLGLMRQGRIKVDLVADLGPVHAVEMADPHDRLLVGRLVTRPYRLYPVVMQIADKVCATVQQYGGRPSSREKDLVDIVTLANTQSIPSSELRAALLSEAERRHLVLPPVLEVPIAWGRAYERAVQQIPVCHRHLKIEDARGLISEFIDPVLGAGLESQSWDPEALGWSL